MKYAILFAAWIAAATSCAANYEAREAHRHIHEVLKELGH